MIAAWRRRTPLWANPGGDFLGAPSVTGTVGGIGFYTWNSTAALLSDVQMWLDDPATNFGWAVIGEESLVASTKRFDSRENADPPPFDRNSLFSTRSSPSRDR